MGNLCPNNSPSSYAIQSTIEVIEINAIADSIIFDTVTCWRTDKRINKVILSYVSYVRNKNKEYPIVEEIITKGKMLEGQMNGQYSFYNTQNNELIAKASYKNGKLYGDVLIFDDNKVVLHYIYKNNRRLGLCDKEGLLLKLRCHVYYYPKKKCKCKDLINNAHYIDH